METDEGYDGLIAAYRHQTLRKVMLFAACLIGIVLAVGLLSVNSYRSISLMESYEVIWNHIIGNEYPLRSNLWWADTYIWNRAMPHALAAILAGAALACCGSLMQSLMGNPLADPYSTGISSGACLGAILAIIMGISVTTMAGGGTVINAFIGAMIPAAIIIILAERIRMTPATLILVGTSLSMFFGSLISIIMVQTDPDSLQQAYLWQVGNMNNIDDFGWDCIPIMLIITVVGSAIVMMLTKKLNVMSLGDNSAQSLGIDVKTFRTLALTLMAIMTAAIVSFVGILGFVGLVCPHIVRLICGSDNKFVVPISMAVGALVLLIADYISVTVGSLPIGVIVSCIGAPMFFLLIIFSKNSGKGALY
ncbi:MAG: iron ABC transporter permease [Candidatus Methanomethylophilaceae archaeon]|nr:iron ABC transporter permease [Candidatus Methanomethylophilaceae archaeon]